MEFGGADGGTRTLTTLPSQDFKFDDLTHNALISLYFLSSDLHMCKKVCKMFVPRCVHSGLIGLEFSVGYLVGRDSPFRVNSPCISSAWQETNFVRLEGAHVDAHHPRRDAGRSRSEGNGQFFGPSLERSGFAGRPLRLSHTLSRI